MRIIMLIDMDYFYVACEELRHPEIKDKPAVVGMDPRDGKGRGVVMTCNYLAREFGIHSGMPISMAYKAKSDAIFLPVDFDYYEKVSKGIMDLIKPYGTKFEQVSVDEAFIDATGKVSDYTGAQILAKRIHDRILSEIGIRCSIGIGPNKLISKMACEKAKPNGIKLVKEEDVKGFISGMDVESLYGIGSKTAQRLRKMGYATAAQLAKANEMKLIDEFGMFGHEAIMFANGIDEREVTENYDIKSIGRELTFEENTNDEKEVEKTIEKLSAEVMKEVAKNQVSFKTVTLKLRYGDFTEHIHSKSIRLTNEMTAIVDTCKELYKRSVDVTRKVRKIGVRVSNFTSYKGQRKII